MYQFITVFFVSLAVKRNFGKTSKISKYYDHSCLQNFPLSFMFLLTVLDQTRKSCNTKFGPPRKDRKSSYHVRQISTLFCNLVALILG